MLLEGFFVNKSFTNAWKCFNLFNKKITSDILLEKILIWFTAFTSWHLERNVITSTGAVVFELPTSLWIHYFVMLVSWFFSIIESPFTKRIVLIWRRDQLKVIFSRWLWKQFRCLRLSWLCVFNMQTKIVTSNLSSFFWRRFAFAGYFLLSWNLSSKTLKCLYVYHKFLYLKLGPEGA